jgi:hypothetical protein
LGNEALHLFYVGPSCFILLNHGAAEPLPNPKHEIRSMKKISITKIQMAQTGGNKRSDTPTRAKKLKSMVLNGAEKVKTRKNTPAVAL